ncbi:amino acid adenylation domain-containing protein [Streptomyces sp. NPDC056503]|uniref:amino acid adenylation domain-containing protein n=1 Tax=Streptomyces sp. NPDC056503 TaxID=3345842 RepID=UPI0036B9B587
MTVRRTVRLAGGVAERLRDGRGLLVAAVALLAGRYCDGDGFRVGVRRGGRAGVLDVSLPAGGSVGELCGAVGAGLAGGWVAGGSEAVEGLRVRCVVDGAVEGVAGDEVVFSGEATAEGFSVFLDCHEHGLAGGFGERMLGHLAHLLEQMAEDADRPVARLRVPNRAEQALLSGFNETRRDYPRDASIVALFAEQAAARPEAVAVRSEGEAVTYRELHERAEKLAGVLYALGVRAGSRVAFTLDKSPLVLVAILAILRVGAVYVPVDRAVPANRRDFLLADSGAGLLLAEGEEAVVGGVPVLDPGDVAEGEGEGVSLPDLGGVAGEAAYVMYTSGTTGRPKGVLVGQRAVLRLVLGTDYVRLSEGSAILQTGALAFDATTFEFWGALLHGGTVVFAPEGTVLSAAELKAAIARYGVNTLFLTTALFHQLVEQDAGVLAGCQVLVGGEMLSSGHVARAMDACPGSSFVHVYGPTENTTFSVAHPITRRYTGRVPIGRPIANSTAYVMDRHGNPQPLGVPGELYVGGDGLSEGYLGRPELTDRAFVRGGIDGVERLYRTGDVVCWTGDGELDFLGRVDHQVKVRGFRIELGEIERQLVLLGGVREAVVLLEEREGGAASLRAYVTGGVPLDPGELRDGLRAELPEYMVPSSFVQVEAMPLTRNQKIDRAALAALAPAAAVRPADPAAEPGRRLPRTEREVLVAGVFARVLGVEQVFLDDDFFDLGGHSLLAMRLWSGLRSALGVEIELRQILDAPSVARLVAGLDDGRTGGPARPKLAGRTS